MPPAFQPVDLRSDTVTRPTAAMKQAMVAAPLGDDVFGDDPTVIALEEAMAARVGKEAALFVPSGTMANQLAVRVHCRPGDEAIAHAKAHVLNYESGAAAALAGVTIRTIDSADGSLGLENVVQLLHLSDDPHLAPSRLVCYENTHNGCGGVVVPQTDIEAVAQLTRKHGLSLHLDGARLFNAVIASGKTAAELAAPFDTVSVCLSKGLGAPVGSLLCGPRDRMKEARRWRKAMGGGMRQAGVIAAAGLYALQHHVERLADDHARARKLAAAIAETPGLKIDLASIATNLVYFDVDLPWWQAHAGWTGDIGSARVEFTKRLRDKGVRIVGTASRLRAVLHLDVDDAGLEHAIAGLAAGMVSGIDI